MSVYTTVTEAEMRAFTARFDLGPLHTFRGVEAGVENTTYFVTLGKCGAVLQIFEEQTADEIPFFILSCQKKIQKVNILLAYIFSSKATLYVFVLICPF